MKKQSTTQTNEEGSSSPAALTTNPVLSRTTHTDGEATKGIQPGSRHLAKQPVASPRAGPSYTGDHHMVSRPMESSAGAVSSETAHFPHSVGGDHLIFDELQTRHRSYQRPIAAPRQSSPSTESNASLCSQELRAADRHDDAPTKHFNQDGATLSMLKQLQDEVQLLRQQQRSTTPRSSEIEALRDELTTLRLENARVRNQSVLRDLGGSFSARDRTKNIPKVDANDLQSSFSTFLIHCKVLGITSDADILDAALVALPKTVISSFFGRYQNDSTLDNLKSYIFESCQVTYPCHMGKSYRTSMKTYFDAENAVNKIMNCPPEELRKFFTTYVMPDNIREEVQKLCYLPWQEFVRGTTHLLSTSSSAPHRNHAARFNSGPANTNNRTGGRRRDDRAPYVCSNHQRFGTNTFPNACEGPACSLYAQTRVRPGNEAQRE